MVSIGQSSRDTMAATRARVPTRFLCRALPATLLPALLPSRPGRSNPSASHNGRRRRAESGEDKLTAIKEPELKCGAKAKWPPRRAGIREQAAVTGIATPAQALALVRSTQVMMDRHINPNYVANMEVFTDTWEGRTVVVLPAGVTVNVGDMIEFDLGHVDPSNPCQYIPNLAVSER